MNIKDRARKIMQVLSESYPDAPYTYLNYNNEYQLLIATILSASTTDACVNRVIPILFERYPGPQDLMMANIRDIIDVIRPCGTYNRKAHYIRESARLIVERFAGRIPCNMKDLISLPGVNRKTANVVLSVAFRVNEGVVVDTHVMRVTQRIGFTDEMKSRDKVERILMQVIPRPQWYEYSRLIGTHGRRTCKARRPQCSTCSISYVCRYYATHQPIHT